MKKKKTFSSVERLLIAAIALCLAIAGAMGFLFFKVTCENREAEQELTLIEQQALRTAASQTPQPTLTAELTPETARPFRKSRLRKSSRKNRRRLSWRVRT